MITFNRSTGGTVAAVAQTLWLNKELGKKQQGPVVSTPPGAADVAAIKG